jgi:hypothetical protein
MPSIPKSSTPIPARKHTCHVFSNVDGRVFVLAMLLLFFEQHGRFSARDGTSIIGENALGFGVGGEHWCCWNWIEGDVTITFARSQE